MGVPGLWNILLTIASKQEIQLFSGYRIAIDASIWLMKVGSILETDSERLKSLFNKILWLRKHNIKPIFVFDGVSPTLKRKTLQQRRKRRRELNDIDIQKKVEIELLKKIQNRQQTSLAQKKADNKKQIDEKLEETDLMLDFLLKAEKESETVDLEQKKLLQCKLLDKKYELLLELSPQLNEKYGSLSHFQSHDFDNKISVLRQIEKGGFERQNYRAFRRDLTEEEKIIYDMELVKKKAKIRQLQDNLYRKVSQKRRQNGYQIIETMENGKKLIQKRKLHTGSITQNFGHYIGKKPQSNNFKAIFQNKREQDLKQLQKAEKAGNFFQQIFTKDYKNKSQHKIYAQNFQELKRKSQNSQCSPPKRKNSQSSFSSVPSSSSSDFSQPDFDLFQGHNREEKIESDNIDQFPEFIKEDAIEMLPSTADNMEFQNLLSLLGISFIVAPAEAEAQCAALQKAKLVDAVATEDSDVFLFGARTVIRGLFQNNLKVYSMQSIEKKLNLNQPKLILFGMMLGSDYTEGIKGIGIVNAMQILKVYGDIQSLKRMTEWAKTADVLQTDEKNTTNYVLERAQSQAQRQFYRLHRKYKNYWHVNPNFPENHVYDAYQKPETIKEDLLQKQLKKKKEINVESISQLMEEKFGMGKQIIEHNIKILQRQHKEQQRKIYQYLSSGQLAKIKSKRLQKAIQ